MGWRRKPRREVVRIGGDEGSGVGVGGDEKIEEGRGYDGALGDSASDVALWGSGVVVSAGSCPPTDVSGQPPDDIGIKGGVGYCGEEEGLVHDVKGLGKVQ